MDLSQKYSGKDLVEILNVFICTATVVQRNIHLLHWNIRGPRFIHIHTYFNTLYEDLVKDIDLVGEQMAQNNLYPQADLESCLQLSRSKSINSEKFAIDYGIITACEQYEILKKISAEMYDIANTLDVFTIADVATDLCRKYEQIIWFLKSENSN